MSHPVRFHFDFISPYSYLALATSARFATEHDIEWEVRPVLYAALLDATGLVGPAETPAKRAYTARDIMRVAARLAVPLVGPPTHPFNPLLALRTVCRYQDDPQGPALARSLAAACWGQGRDLSDPGTVAAVVTDFGLAPIDAGDPALKDRLRSNTTTALESGVFGVPTFVWEGELFWGHDRMEDLARRIEGGLPDPEPAAAAWASRPRGAERAASPWPRS